MQVAGSSTCQLAPHVSQYLATAARNRILADMNAANHSHPEQQRRGSRTSPPNTAWEKVGYHEEEEGGLFKPEQGACNGKS